MTPLEQALEEQGWYRDALQKALRAQRFQIGDGSMAREKQMAELKQIRDGLDAVNARIAYLQAANAPARRIVYLR